MQRPEHRTAQTGESILSGRLSHAAPSVPAVNAKLVTFLINTAVGVRCGARAASDGHLEAVARSVPAPGGPAVSLNW